MKKSQILAALALAFALGVVAPVAGTYATPQARVDTGDTAVKSATNDNLKSAVNYVTSKPTYKAFATYAEALEAASVKGIKDVTAANTGVTEALKNFAGSSTTGGNTVAALIANIGNLRSAVGTDYDKYVALYEAVNSNVTEIGTTAALNKVKAAMNGLGYTFNIEDTDTFNTDSTQNPDTNVVAQAKALIDANDKVEDYNDYMSAVAAVKTAEATRDAFNGLQGALKNANLGLTKDQIKKVNDANSISDLKAVVPADNTAWSNVAQQITKIEDAIKNENGTTNTQRYALLDSATDPKGLLQLMQIATDNEDLTYAELISAAPIIPTDPVDPEKPGEGDDNNQDGEGDGKGDGATTPDTGVIANSEATATSTASIMAGIATALTAAGVGVVAFRNIRRNKKA